MIRADIPWQPLPRRSFRHALLRHEIRDRHDAVNADSAMHRCAAHFAVIGPASRGIAFGDIRLGGNKSFRRTADVIAVRRMCPLFLSAV
jgi:hypothetical protein